MINNLYSLGLLRNGKVYETKQLAIQGLRQVATNDGVAKLARYLEYVVGSDQPIIKTIVGFYANADEMEDAQGGQSYYTIFDFNGSSGDIEEIKEEINAINGIIGAGISDKTLTEAINEINSKLGDGFTEDHTVADALTELEEALTEALAITLESSEDDPDYAKVYTLKQGGELIGTINIPKDIVIKEGKLVYGKWEGETFYENTEEHHYGDETAIKLVLNNDDKIYINTKDLVDVYTAGSGIVISDNEISVNIDGDGEPFLTLSENGIKLSGVQTAIDSAVEMVKLDGSDGISIASNKVKAVAASYSAPFIKNPITVGKDGIKFANTLDCGFFDTDTAIASSAEDIEDIQNPQEKDVFINGDEAFGALSTRKKFNNLEVSDINSTEEVFLYANNIIDIDGINASGEKGATNGRFNFSAKEVNVKNLTVENGSTIYNVFEGDGSNANLEALNVKYVTVDNPSLRHNVFNVYKPKSDAVINISDSKFNLTVDNSNVLRISNCGNATGITVNFENVEWTYENSITKDDWSWAGLIIYQPYGTDSGFTGDLEAMKTWEFNFKNCKYNGTKVTSNNFGEHNQVFYIYNMGNTREIDDPVVNGLTLNFE